MGTPKIKRAKTIEGMLVELMKKIEESKDTGSASVIERYEEDIQKLLIIVEDNELDISKTVLKAAKKIIT